MTGPLIESDGHSIKTFTMPASALFHTHVAEFNQYGSFGSSFSVSIAGADDWIYMHLTTDGVCVWVTELKQLSLGKFLRATRFPFQMKEDQMVVSFAHPHDFVFDFSDKGSAECLLYLKKEAWFVTLHLKVVYPKILLHFWRQVSSDHFQSKAPLTVWFAGKTVA